MITLYHGSNKQIDRINDNGLFQGIFATSDKAAALSHGDYLHTVSLDDSEILTDYALNYVLDYDAVFAALNRITQTDDDGRVFDVVVAQSAVMEADVSLFSAADTAEAGWDAQRIRGQLAKELGYKAVEMKDEHGITYLVNSLADIK